MIKVLFVCHGNICRSPMAEFVMKDLVRKQHLEHEFSIASAATSMEEIGNDIHRGTKAILNQYHIPYERRAARRMERRDYEEYDYLLGMDSWNIRNMQRIAGGDEEHKIWMLSEFAGLDRDVESVVHRRFSDNIRRCTRRMPGAFGIHKKRTQFITNIIKYNKEKE